MKVSIVIPMYNEERNAPALFGALNEFLDSPKSYEREVIFVNDGSGDATEKLLSIYVAGRRSQAKVISYADNKGKGYAVREGMRVATGDWRVFLDADLAVSLEHVDMLSFIPDGTEVVVGSRVVPGASIVVPQPWLRRVLGGGFTILANLITGLSVSDHTCGFKCFSSYAAERIFSTAQIDRWAFDTELMVLAKKFGIPIKEIPISWRNGKRTNVRPWRDIPRSLYDLFRAVMLHR